MFIPLLLLILLGGLIYAANADYQTLKSMNTPNPKASVIKIVYFYLVSLIALMVLVFSTADLINQALVTWVFPKAAYDEYAPIPCEAQIYRDPAFQESEEAYQAKIDACAANQLSAEETRSIRKQKSIVRDLSLLVVSIPLFLYHWLTIRKEQKKEK